MKKGDYSMPEGFANQIFPIYIFPQSSPDLLGPFGVYRSPGTEEEELVFY